VARRGAQGAPVTQHGYTIARWIEKVLLHQLYEPRRFAIGQIELVQLTGEILMVEMQPFVLGEITVSTSSS
jgi:hypothetical protein